MKKPVQTGAEKLVSDALAIYDVADSLEMSGENNMAAFLRKKLDDILSFAYSLDKTSKTEELITDVTATIVDDILSEDLQALEELLYFVPKENLIAYLSDEDQQKHIKP
jgi:hypothetical protein